MLLEAVIVCHDYADFLEYTLPENLPYFNHLVVVTHPNDKATQALCRKYSVTCVESTCMHDEGHPFNKGRAINLGLAHLKGLDWVLHLDADVVLPHDFKQMLYRARLRNDVLYGADRVNVYGCDHWCEHRHKTVPHHSEGYFVEPPKEFPLGARIIHHEHGYVPIGYFQLWNRNCHKRYPINQGTAEHTDVLFACQWDRQHRLLLPEVVVYHLESELKPGPMGGNWKGRKSPPFRCKHHHGPHCHHRHHHHHGYKPKC